MTDLMLMRHAKSSWADESLADHDRPLNKRGLRDAPRIGHWLMDQALVPQLTLSSTATRAKATAELVTAEFDDGHQLVTDRRLYHAGPEDFADVLSEFVEQAKQILVISHNPGLESWIYHLTGQYARMPTAAVAVIGFEHDLQWGDLRRGARGELNHVWRPKEIF